MSDDIILAKRPNTDLEWKVYLQDMILDIHVGRFNDHPVKVKL